MTLMLPLNVEGLLTLLLDLQSHSFNKILYNSITEIKARGPVIHKHYDDEVISYHMPAHDAITASSSEWLLY